MRNIRAFLSRKSIAPTTSTAGAAAELHEKSQNNNQQLAQAQTEQSAILRDDLFVRSQGILVVGAIAWMIMLIVSVVSYQRFNELTELDLFAGTAPCIVLQLLLLTMSMRLQKCKTVDSLVSVLKLHAIYI